MISALILTIAANIMPNPEAFQRWQKVDGYTSSDVNIDSLQKVQIQCALDSKSLYATHPQEATKLMSVN